MSTIPYETLEAEVAELREEARALEVLNRTGTALAAELDLGRLVQIVTDAGVELSGAEFGAFFYNVVRPDGEAYTLYTLSGAPREAFAAFPMPRNTQVFEPTFRGIGVLRSADILADPRYGKMAPYHGMPPGHLPVRSYLAVPVTSRTGEVLGGFSLVIPSPESSPRAPSASLWDLPLRPPSQSTTRASIRQASARSRREGKPKRSCRS